MLPPVGGFCVLCAFDRAAFRPIGNVTIQQFFCFISPNCISFEAGSIDLVKLHEIKKTQLLFLGIISSVLFSYLHWKFEFIIIIAFIFRTRMPFDPLTSIPSGIVLPQWKYQTLLFFIGIYAFVREKNVQKCKYCSLILSMSCYICSIVLGHCIGQ